MKARMCTNASVQVRMECACACMHACCDLYWNGQGLGGYLQHWQLEN